jgi:hypothetical protein
MQMDHLHHDDANNAREPVMVGYGRLLSPCSVPEALKTHRITISNLLIVNAILSVEEHWTTLEKVPGAVMLSYGAYLESKF